MKSAHKDLIKNIVIEKNASEPGRMPGRGKRCEQMRITDKIKKILKNDGRKRILIITKITEKRILNMLERIDWLRAKETAKIDLYRTARPFMMRLQRWTCQAIKTL
ncbi:MAG: hypothetical protein PF503_21830 [Desulfobacula sp.]|nr:hypothetical protein [Desulfobacula sp.]